MLIALSAPAAPKNYLAAVFVGHIRDHLATLRLLDHGSLRYPKNQIRPVFSRTIIFSALCTVLCTIFSFVAKFGQGIQPLVHDKNYIAALAAVAAIWSPCRHKKFPSETYMAVAALAGADINIRAVRKHGFLPSFGYPLTLNQVGKSFSPLLARRQCAT